MSTFPWVFYYIQCQIFEGKATAAGYILPIFDGNFQQSWPLSKENKFNVIKKVSFTVSVEDLCNMFHQQMSVGKLDYFNG